MNEKATYAFPTGDHNNFDGMTLRDWFAGQALAAIIRKDADIDIHDVSSTVARFSYRYADAMMIERAK